MTEEKKEPDELTQAKARIAELERENKALQGKKKMLTTSMITAPPMTTPRKNIMISTTIRKPGPIGDKSPMLQTHGLNLPEPDAAKILDRVKKARAADAKKETK